MSVVKIETVAQYEKLKKLGLVIVDYYTNWCGPCKKFAPVFEKMAQENPNVTFLSVDAESLEHEDCENIASVPTFRVFFNGNMKREFSGIDKERLERYIKKYEVQIFINGRTQRSFTPDLQEKILKYMQSVMEDGI
jgi:thiol-disulfide isomerase/thioredoxin